jgi:long-chain acyl-CoA synthetase
VAFTLSPGKIQSHGNQFARLLERQEVPERGVVACVLPNCPEFAFALRGITWCGRVLTPINWHLSASDIDYIIENSEADALLIHSDFSEIALKICHRIPPQFRFSVGGKIEGFSDFEQSLDLPRYELDNPVAGDVMMYTSGTTGRPKGVRRKSSQAKEQPPPGFHGSAGKAMLLRYLKEESHGAHIVVAPYYHSAPLTYGEGASLLGADLVIMETWNPEEFLRLVEEHKVASTFLVPTHFVRLLRLPEATRMRYDLSSLKLIVHGAAPVSPTIKHQMIEWLGPVLFEFYGGTEGGGTSISSQDWLQHPGSVGKPGPGLYVHILDEQDEELSAGEIGDIYFSSDISNFEYKADAEKTASAYRGNKYTLGDIGYQDEEGYLYLCDRRADTIITGGVNIFPVQIEDVLINHPAIAEACVVGILDNEWGEKILAVVELCAGFTENDSLTAELEKHCLDNLGTQQMPKAFRYSDKLPRTDTGKILRREIRDHYRKAFSKRQGND